MASNIFKRSGNKFWKINRCHSVEKIKTSVYKDDVRTFDFHTVDADTVMSMIKNINPRKATRYNNIPGKLIQIAHRELSTLLCNLINKSMKFKGFPGTRKSSEVAILYIKRKQSQKRQLHTCQHPHCNIKIA